jgi:triacylglycerol esterase/lipase EstA (alpha/beta hydrolase family)
VGLLRPFILANFTRAFECYCRDKVARNAPFYPRLLRSRPPSLGLLTTVDLSGPVSRGTGSLSPRSRALLPRRGAGRREYNPVAGGPMPSWKYWFRRGIAVIIALIVFVAALCAAGLAPYFLAAWSASIPLLALSATLAFALLAWGGAWLGALIWHAGSRRRFATAFGGILTTLFLAALYFAVLWPSPPRLAETVPFDNTRYWQLPTGSRIAYSEYDPPAGVAARPDPIVFLHGGPGMRTGQFDLDFYSPFAARGFHVYLFDQAGSGLSGFLPSVRDYSITRAVQDLESVRQQIGSQKMILIGHSWGSTLAASYMAKFPDHVAKVVFYSPGALWNWSQEVPDFSRTEGGSPGFPSPRLLAALLLLDRNPDAAQNLLPRREAEELLLSFIRPTVGTLVCKGDSNKLPPFMTSLAAGPHFNPGFNPYVLN